MLKGQNVIVLLMLYNCLIALFPNHLILNFANKSPRKQIPTALETSTLLGGWGGEKQLRPKGTCQFKLILLLSKTNILDACR